MLLITNWLKLLLNMFPTATIHRTIAVVTDCETMLISVRNEKNHILRWSFTLVVAHRRATIWLQTLYIFLLSLQHMLNDVKEGEPCLNNCMPRKLCFYYSSMHIHRRHKTEISQSIRLYTNNLKLFHFQNTCVFIGLFCGISTSVHIVPRNNSHIIETTLGILPQGELSEVFVNFTCTGVYIM